jgi:hypothetical protein
MEKMSFERKRSDVKYCPCGKSNKDGKFAPYQGFDDKGYCHSCDKTFSPTEEKNESKEKGGQRPFSPPPPKPLSFIDPTYLDASLKGYDQNNFVQFLIKRFGKSTAMRAVEVYKIGTSKRWPGATIFWQIDDDHKIRSGKIMVYDPSTGKRNKTKNSWAHSVLKIDDFNLKQCLYGSHLLRSESIHKPVSIVESEKTAIIASILKPEFIWMATGGKAGLKGYKFNFLKDRDILFFPDLTKPGDEFNCFEMWADFARELRDDIPGIKIQASDYLEKLATDEEKSQGLDIVDYFLKWEWDNEENEPPQKEFIFSPIIPNEKNERNEPLEKPFISGQIIRDEDDEIRLIEKQIEEVIQDIGREKAKESSLRNAIQQRREESESIWRKITLVRNEIKNHFIPGEAIQANKDLLRNLRERIGYFD